MCKLPSNSLRVPIEKGWEGVRSGYKLNRSAPERGKMKPEAGERAFYNERAETDWGRWDSGDKGESEWDLCRENFCRMANREMKRRGGEKKVICEGRGGKGLKRSDIEARTKTDGIDENRRACSNQPPIQRSTFSFWGLISITFRFCWSFNRFLWQEWCGIEVVPWEIDHGSEHEVVFAQRPALSQTEFQNQAPQWRSNEIAGFRMREKGKTF